MMKYGSVFSILAIITGLFFTYFGRKLFMVALFLVGLVMTVFVILLVFYSTFLRAETKQWVAWVVISLSAILGVGVGFLSTMFARFGGAIIGGWGGFLLGLLLNETWLYVYGSVYLFWTINVVCALVCALLAYYIFDHAVMVSTAFMGSYFICRGISYWVGGFPSAYELVDKIKRGDIYSVDPVFYAYLALIALLTISGYIVQRKLFKRMGQEE
jgi:hypothetical protein